MKIIVGLGNPGKQYEKTRHNSGFMALDKLAELLHVNIDQKKFNALYGQTMHQGEKIFLLKPQTYMNNSGESVRAICDYFQVDVDDILVIYDDLDLPVGKLRLREQGSAGGQKGVKSIMQHLGTQNFPRIRVGIGKDPNISTVDYVLGKVKEEDRELFDESLNNAAQAALASISSGFDQVMAKFNKK